MLATLRIQNLALAENLTIGFQPALTAITGETGAGKSILIGALKLALGERADRGQIRAGADHCTVEAVFDLAPGAVEIPAFLSAQGIDPDPDGQLFLKRTFSAAGTNRQFINGSPAPLQTLARLGELLVDLHGPHDHQSLLHAARQRDILDAFGNLEPARGEFGALCARFRDLEGQRAELQEDDRTPGGQAELLRFQAGEIEAARLQPGEEEELGAAHARAANAARIVESSRQALELLADDDQAILALSAQLTRCLQEIARLDPAAAPLLALQEQAAALLGELQTELRRHGEKIDLNPERLREIEERVGLIQSLKRKYGRAIPEILAFGLEAAAKLARLEGRGETVAALDRELAVLRESLWQTGRELSRQRRKLIPRLVKATVAELNDLGFKDCRFEIGLTSADDPASPVWTNANGLDEVEFQFSPNVGEPLRPLRAIASSGEMARVMLALKTALAEQDQVPVLVFDEIDANVGGETAARVGEKMLEIARRRQVLCITHLAPVAAAAQNHLVVTKQVRENRTVIEVASPGAGDRVDEIARMLGGRSRAALDHAQTLLQKR